MLDRRIRGLALASLSCCALIGAAAQAEPFNWQVSGGVTRSDPPGSGSSDAASVAATYSFDPVDAATGPLELASFLDPSSQIFANASRAESDLSVTGIGFIGASEQSVDSYTLGGRYVLPGSRWFAGGTFAASYPETSPTPFASTGGDADTYTLVAGKYFGARTTLSLVLGRSEQSTEFPSLCLLPFCRAGSTTLEVETRSASLEAFHLWQGRSMTYSLSGGVSQSAASFDVTFTPTLRTIVPLPSPPAIIGAVVIAPVPLAFDDRVNVYRVAGEIFPTARLGVSIGFARADGRGATTSDGTADVAATWFFKERIGLRFSYSHNEFDNGIDDAHGSAIRLIGRF